MTNGLKKVLVACLSVMLPLQSLLAQSTSANDLPDIGSPASSTLSLDDEFRIGLQVMRQLRDEALAFALASANFGLREWLAARPVQGDLIGAPSPLGEGRGTG